MSYLDFIFLIKESLPPILYSHSIEKFDTKQFSNGNARPFQIGMLSNTYVLRFTKLNGSGIYPPTLIAAFTWVLAINVDPKEIIREELKEFSFPLYFSQWAFIIIFVNLIRCLLPAALTFNAKRPRSQIGRHSLRIARPYLNWIPFRNVRPIAMVVVLGSLLQGKVKERIKAIVKMQIFSNIDFASTRTTLRKSKTRRKVLADINISGYIWGKRIYTRVPYPQ